VLQSQLFLQGHLNVRDGPLIET